MQKRIVILFFLTVGSLCALTFKIISINAGDYAEVATYNNSKSLQIVESRGTIYDTNLEPMVNVEDEYAVAMKPTSIALSSVEEYVGAERMAILREELAQGLPVLLRVPQRIEGGDDIRVVSYKRRYADEQYATHLIGYIDGDGVGVSGLEKSYDDYLSEASGSLRAVFYVDALGRNLGGAEIDILEDGYNLTRGVVLTIDMNVQRVIEDTLERYGWESGSAVAMDPNTGEIKAMVSAPDYDPNNVADSLEAEGSPLLNKALQAYSVGSTFKVVVAAAALEEDSAYAEFKRNCSGSVMCGDTEFKCFDGTVHGEQTMKDALVHSCNTYFIELAREIGAKKIIATAEKMGFGKQNLLASGITAKSGSLPDAESVDTLGELANLGFGQGGLLATPVQLATSFASVANGGTYVVPYLFRGYVDDDGDFSETSESRSARSVGTLGGTRIISRNTSVTLSSMLASAVAENERIRSEKVTAAGKTATAQTGQFVDGVEVCHTWFAGWYPADNPELVIVLMKESGVTGVSDCGPVFKNIVDSLTSDGK